MLVPLTDKSGTSIKLDEVHWIGRSGGVSHKAHPTSVVGVGYVSKLLIGSNNIPSNITRLVETVFTRIAREERTVNNPTVVPKTQQLIC